MVNKYAADMMAQKYRKAVMKVITILSECRIVSILEVSICSIRFGFWVKQSGDLPGGLAGAFNKGSEQRFSRVGIDNRHVFLAIFTDSPCRRRADPRSCMR